MAGKPEHDAEIELTLERFSAATTRVLQGLIAGLRPIVEATVSFFRTFNANRRIRRAIETRRWSKAGWYIADHKRRSEARKPIWQEFNEIVTAAPDKALSSLPVDGAERHDAYLAGGGVGVAETAEGG